MRRARGVITGLLVATALALPLVGPPAVTPAAAAEHPPPANTSARTGVPGNIYAIGDSITTATGTAALGDEHPANSWVTGTHPSSRPDGRGGSPDVLSMRHRLGIPQGSAHNLAHNGQRMVHFDDQANQLPSSAQYVVVELGGNDLCRPSVAEMTSEANYRAQFRAGLQAVTNRAPNALIFVASIPDIYNLWFLRRGSLKARTFWDNPTGFVIPCESLLQNPGSNSSSDENRRRQVRSRTIAFNNILEEECAAVLRCRFDGHGLFVRSSNRANPFDNNSAYLPEGDWWFRDQDISHDQGTWGFLCPANFNYTGCGDHFHPSHWGQAKLALSGHTDSYQFLTDATAPTRSITPARPPDGAGVYRSEVQVSFGGTDANGLRGQEVRVQNAAGQLGPWQQHLGIAPPLTISEVGTTYVQVRSLDKNGNLSSSTTLAVTIDPSQFGDVEGTVTGPFGPLSGVEVTLHDADTEGVLATDTTGADGTYSFTGLLEADDVKIRASDPSGVHLPEWYDDAPDHASATAIDVPGGGTATADLQLSPVPGTVAGTVTGPSGPLDGIEVTLHPTGAEGAVATTSTEADGSYEVEVAPGDYKVRFRDPSGVHLTEWHDDVPAHASATAVTVVKEQTTTVDATLALTPGTVAGTVTGPSGPLAGIEVTVHPTGSEGAVATTSTGADGTYAFDLLPGDYKVRFVDPSGDHLTEWFDDASTHGAADAVTVTHSTSTVVDAALGLTPGTLAGTVTGPSGPLAGIEVTVHPTGSEGAVATASTGADGTYALDLVPGDYKVRFVDPDGVHVTEWHDDAADHAAATAVTVTKAQTSTVDADLALTPGSIQGTVTGADGPLAGVEVTVHQALSVGGLTSTTTAADGTYELALVPGKYKIRFVDPSGDHVTEWFDGAADHASATAVQVLREQTETVDADLALTPGSIQGTVTGPDGPAEGVEVTVTPGGASTTTGPDGTYEIGGLQPGAYQVTTTAVECAWTSASDAAEVPRGGGHDTVDLAVAEPPPGPHGLTDVAAWIEDAVRWLVDTCNDPPYMTGFADNTFRAGDALTRAQAVRALWRIAGEPAVADPHGLGDVPAWVEPAVRWAVANGYMTGFADNTFRPDDPINRAQMARLLYRLSGSPPGPFDPAHTFPDVPNWVADAVGWMFAEGHITGINGRFEPDRSTTRGQFASQTFAVFA